MGGESESVGPYYHARMHYAIAPYLAVLVDLHPGVDGCTLAHPGTVSYEGVGVNLRIILYHSLFAHIHVGAYVDPLPQGCALLHAG